MEVSPPIQIGSNGLVAKELSPLLGRRPILIVVVPSTQYSVLGTFFSLHHQGLQPPQY